MHQDNVAISASGFYHQSLKRVADRLLAHVSTFHNVDAVAELELAQLLTDAFDFALLDSNIDRFNTRNVKECSEAVHQDRHAVEREKLLRSGSPGDGGHPGANARSGKNDEYTHRNRSIQDMP